MDRVNRDKISRNYVQNWCMNKRDLQERNFVILSLLNIKLIELS